MLPYVLLYFILSFVVGFYFLYTSYYIWFLENQAQKKETKVGP